MRSRLIRTILLSVIATLVGTNALSDIVYETDDPFGGDLGVLGFDVYENQSVGVRFTPDGDFTLEQFSVWLWNNDESGRQPLITFTLRNDQVSKGISTPGNQIHELWTFNLPNTGIFQPTLFSFDSEDMPLLESGVRYWLVAESDAQGGADPVWALAFPTQGWSSRTDFNTGQWVPATFGVVPATTIEGTPVKGDTTQLVSFEISNGTLLDGQLSDLLSSDDSHVHTRSGFGQTLIDLHNMEMIVNAVTTVDTASTIDLTIESRIDEPAGLAQIKLFNWDTKQLESVGTYSLGNADNIDTINNISATNYIDGSGNIDLSIKHLVFVPFLAFTFESFIDHVEILVQ